MRPKLGVTRRKVETYGCKRFHRVKVTDFIEEISEFQRKLQIRAL